MGISLPNTPAYLVPSMAAMHSGAAAALLNPIYTPAEVEHALGIARCVSVNDELWMSIYL